MTKTRVGRWAALFGGRRSFRDEIESAVEIGAAWRQIGRQRDIVLDELPGWLAPMWGSDQEWLYLRRPQGVWKTRLPPAADDGASNALHMRATTSGSPKLRGGMSMGRSILGVAGWVKGADAARPMEAADRDEALRPSARGFCVDADELGSWVKLLESGRDAVVLDAGDRFASPPTFELKSGWLVATDEATGLRVAFPAEDGILELVQDGRLWAQFGGKWLDPFKTRVVVEP